MVDELIKEYAAVDAAAEDILSDKQQVSEGGSMTCRFIHLQYIIYSRTTAYRHFIALKEKKNIEGGGLLFVILWFMGGQMLTRDVSIGFYTHPS